MSTAEEFEGYAQEIAGDDSSWMWEMDFQTETTPSVYDSGFLSGEDKIYGEAEIRWTRDDISVTASIIGREVQSPDDWFTIASITKGDDRVKAEFHSKASTISELKAALSDPEYLLGPIRSSLSDEIGRRVRGQFAINMQRAVPWGRVRGIDLRKGAISAYIGYWRGKWNLDVGEYKPMVEGGRIVDYETLNQADLWFDEEERLLEAIEELVADPRVFF